MLASGCLYIDIKRLFKGSNIGSYGGFVRSNGCFRYIKCDVITTLLRLTVGVLGVSFHSLAFPENVITPSIHLFSLDNGSQTILGKNADFSGASGIGRMLNGGFQYLYRFENGMALGGEFEMNRWEYESPEYPSQNDYNDATYRALFIVVRKYFNVRNMFRPYIGFGLGKNEVDLNGHIDAHLEGNVGQIHAGFAIMFEGRAGFDLGYKRLQGSSTDVNGGDMNLDGNMFILGLTIQH